MMNQSLYLNIKDGVDFGCTPVEWHQDFKTLEFGDAPYNFYDYVDNLFGFSEEEDSPRMIFLDKFYDALHDQIATIGAVNSQKMSISIDNITIEATLEANY